VVKRVEHLYVVVCMMVLAEDRENTTFKTHFRRNFEFYENTPSGQKVLFEGGLIRPKYRWKRNEGRGRELREEEGIHK
jgi:hypothetical protein